MPSSEDLWAAFRESVLLASFLDSMAFSRHTFWEGGVLLSSLGHPEGCGGAVPGPRDLLLPCCLHAALRDYKVRSYCPHGERRAIHELDGRGPNKASQEPTQSPL